MNLRKQEKATVCEPRTVGVRSTKQSGKKKELLKFVVMCWSRPSPDKNPPKNLKRIYQCSATVTAVVSPIVSC